MKWDATNRWSDDQIVSRLRAASTPSSVMPPQADEGGTPRFADPISTAALPLIDVLQHSTDNLIDFGITELDLYLRGLRAKELTLVVAYPHSGKTQLLLTLILNNPDKRILFLSLDDPREAILQKLVCMAYMIPGLEFEERVRLGDPDMAELLRTNSVERFANLLVSDHSMNVNDLDQAVLEATNHWGAPPQLVALDYVGLLATEKHGVEDGFSSISTKLKELKGFAKGLPCPLLVVHQGTRSGAKPGSRITLTSMGFAGEQEATIVIGLRRKRDDEERDALERHRLRNTVTIDIPKLKRVGGRLSGPEGIDLFLDPSNGLIRSLYETDFD